MPTTTLPATRTLLRWLDAALMRGARRLHPWRVRAEGERPRAIALPYRWRQIDRPVWFEHTLQIDESLRGTDLLLRLDVAEGLLLVDGEPFHGLDRNHTDVVLPAERTRTDRVALSIEASRAAPFGGSWFKDARLVPFDEPTARLSHRVAALDGLRDALPAGHDRDAVAALLDELQRVLRPRRDAAGSRNANAEAAALVERFSRRARNDVRRQRGAGARPAGVVHLVGHSHIDVAWLWTLAETRRKCARTFSTTLRLMERYPEFCFAQSQALLYDFVKHSYPSIFEQVRTRVQEGRWHPIGSTWVEPDCNIPNGESLVRQIQHGRRFFAREFGVQDEVLWLPDTFGYAWSLPQILRQCGIRAFFTTKLLWNDTTRFPHHSFWWEGVDGTRILAHNPPVGLEGLVSAKHLRKSWSDYRERTRTSHVLQTYGYGDGGGGVTAEHLDAAKVLGTAPGLPAARHSSAQAFFEALRRDGRRLPTWRDELYLELHRGTYTTHAWLKRANRRAEASLYVTDLLCALASGTYGAEAWQEVTATLDALWKRLLTNQFHDIVPGTAVEAAYADTRRDFSDLERGCQALQQAALDSMAPAVPATRPGAVTVFNPLPWERVAHVMLPVDAGATSVQDHAGDVQPSQSVRENRQPGLLCSVRVPALGCARVVPVTGNAGQQRGTRGARRSTAQPVLDAPLVRVAFDPHGSISSFVDKASGRDIVSRGTRLNEFLTFRDEPTHWEAWDIDPDYERKPVEIFRDAAVEIVEDGPVRWRARVSLRSDGRTRLEQDLIAYADTACVEFVTRARWHERRTLLKVAFPLAVRAGRATYEIPFGAIARPTLARTRRDRARWEVAGQQWADLSERGFGVSLLNDSKYGYDCRGSVLRLTLIRSPRYPHHAEPMTKTSGRFTDQGEHRFTYALLPHAGTWREGGTVRRARELNVPCEVLDGWRVPEVPAVVALEAGNIQVSAIAFGEVPGEVLVRLYECHGASGPANITIGWPGDTIREVDLTGRPIRTLRVRRGRVRLVFRAFEIKTLCLSSAPSRGSRGEWSDAR